MIVPRENAPTLNLAAEIYAAFRDATGHAEIATKHARLAVTQAVKCGRLLNQQKAALPHGAWEAWLAANCPHIPARTATRYMGLAKREEGGFLDDAVGLRHGYLATGVIPECRRAPKEPDANTPTVTFTRGLDIFRRWLNQRTRELPVERWTPDARRALRQEIAWIKRFYDQLNDDEPEDPQPRLH
jgi:hypothetical protein